MKKKASGRLLRSVNLSSRAGSEYHVRKAAAMITIKHKIGMHRLPNAVAVARGKVSQIDASISLDSTFGLLTRDVVHQLIQRLALPARAELLEYVHAEGSITLELRFVEELIGC